MDPPLSIPNREVKRTNADGTDRPVGRVGSRRSSKARSRKRPGLFVSFGNRRTAPTLVGHPHPRLADTKPPLLVSARAKTLFQTRNRPSWCLLGQKFYWWGLKCLTRRGNQAKALRVGVKMPDLSRKTGKSTTGSVKNARPVEETGQKLYG